MGKKAPPPQKEKGQRVKDAVEILTNLKNIGISDQDVGYLETKQILDQFIEDGQSWSGKVQFPRHARYAEMILTGRADRKNTYVLKATEELRRKMKEDNKT